MPSPIQKAMKKHTFSLVPTLLVVAGSSLAVACSGETGDNTKTPITGLETPDSTPDPTPTGVGPDVAAPGAEPIDPANLTFGVTGTTQLQLLPFDNRLRRVADVAGVDISDPILEAMRASAHYLGDYDYAEGVPPDSSWNASRINEWARTLIPVCSSMPMMTRYPSFPEFTPQLIANAWGREAMPEDLQEIQDSVDASGLDPAVAYQTVCIAVLSAAEFVYR
jgi:hypothetical protein